MTDPATIWIDVGGAAIIGVTAGAGPRLAASVRRAFAPYASHDEPAPEIDVLIRPMATKPVLQDIEGAAGDRLVTGYDGELAYILRDGKACVLPDPLGHDLATFAYTPGFPVQDLVRSYVRPAVALAATRHGAVVVHASAVALNGRAILVGGWSESGKTEVALALSEAGAEFLSDKWTIVRADGSVCPFPAAVGIRRWVLPYLPKLRAHLPRTARTQVLGAGAAEFVTRPIRRPFRNTLFREAGALSTQVVAMADRAALSLTQVRAAYGNAGDSTTPVPLGLLVLLSTIEAGSPIEVAPVDPALAAQRLARSAAFERRSYFAVTERARYGGANGERLDGPRSLAIDEAILKARLADVAVLEAKTPFPSDPNRVARLILQTLEKR